MIQSIHWRPLQVKIVATLCLIIALISIMVTFTSMESFNELRDGIRLGFVKPTGAIIPILLIALTLIGAILDILFGIMIYQGRNWARLAFTILSILLFVIFLCLLSFLLIMPGVFMPLIYLFGSNADYYFKTKIILYIINIIMIICLYIPSSNLWFSARKVAMARESKFSK
jgi:hypothetical protein